MPTEQTCSPQADARIGNQSAMRLACAHEQLLCLWLGGDMPLQQPLHGRVQRAAAQLHRRGRLPLREAYPLQLHAGLLHLVQRHELQHQQFTSMWFCVRQQEGKAVIQ